MLVMETEEMSYLLLLCRRAVASCSLGEWHCLLID
jgi:hypothetical protein